MRMCVPDLPFFETVGYYLKNLAAIGLIFAAIGIVYFVILMISENGRNKNG